MQLSLYNSLTRSKEVFKAVDVNEIDAEKEVEEIDVTKN